MGGFKDDFDDDFLTEEEIERLRDDYEYYDEWVESEARMYGITLEDYDHSRRVEDYGQ